MPTKCDIIYTIKDVRKLQKNERGDISVSDKDDVLRDSFAHLQAEFGSRRGRVHDLSCPRLDRELIRSALGKELCEFGGVD